MTRGYDDTVHVRLADDPRPDGRDAPSQFLWRGRLYLVSAVLGYWRERQAWWSLEPALAVHGVGGERPGHGVPAPGLPAGGRAADVGADREVWRVEAAPGRSASPGVYHLARDASSPTATATARHVAAGTWRLLQVCD